MSDPIRVGDPGPGSDPGGQQPASQLERRLLVLAPVGRDASLVVAMLLRLGIAGLACRSLGQLVEEVGRGAAAILLTEEVLADPHSALVGCLRSQPPWSDLPVLLLTRPGADSATVERAPHTLGNVTLLERPMRVGSLGSAVRSALRARARQYLTRAHLAELQLADQRKDQFLATLAHELRNPLAPIRNSLNIVRLMGADQPAAPVLEIMERQVSHLVRLVDDLMEVSRITRGKIELRREPTELADVIAAAVETSRPLIEAARHELTLALPMEPLVLDADAVRLAQVFANLLNNAARYTDPGGRIALAVARDGEWATVAVRDTGVGIPAHALAGVFDMFAQVNARDRRAQPGLGIGLTLARSLVELHGGTLTAASEGEGRGSEFVVRLPLAPALAAPQRHAAHAPPRIDAQRILVVDDNCDAADTLGALLRAGGADVRVVYDGPAALAAVGEFAPTVVVLDLGMPGMDGFEVARQLRARGDAGGRVLIALTGWGQEQDRQQTESAGFSHHLIKPVDLETIHAALASGLRSVDAR